jgi:lipoic acid synthetase
MSAENKKVIRIKKKPPWLRRKLSSGPECEEIKRLLKMDNLHTVCEEARCPNLWECFTRKTATFLILGDTCTRNCRFCAVGHGTPAAVDPQESIKVAKAAAQMGLKHVVVTSVTRDDLPDGGSNHFANTIKELKRHIHGVTVEVLIPDFKGRMEDLETVLATGPHVLNHNLETVERLYRRVRPEAVYECSLELIKRVVYFGEGILAKSGIMLGLGETREEIYKALKDLRGAGCRMLTLGQYLQPSGRHLRVERYVPPEEFEKWRGEALEMGFDYVASGPFVRSSYHAAALLGDCCPI